MKALVIVDPQLDFCEGGSLAVPDSNAIFPLINELKKSPAFAAVIITKDWHPHDHISFAKNHGKQPFQEILVAGAPQMLWPVHCVQQEQGSMLSPLLEVDDTERIVLKGIVQNEECYSGFGTEENPTELKSLLKAAHVEEVYIVGLALDYCVGLTAIDAARNGFKPTVVSECTKAVNSQTAEQMLNEFQKNGVAYLRLEELNLRR